MQITSGLDPDEFGYNYTYQISALDNNENYESPLSNQAEIFIKPRSVLSAVMMGDGIQILWTPSVQQVDPKYTFTGYMLLRNGETLTIADIQNYLDTDFEKSSDWSADYYVMTWYDPYGMDILGESATLHVTWTPPAPVGPNPPLCGDAGGVDASGNNCQGVLCVNGDCHCIYTPVGPNPPAGNCTTLPSANGLQTVAQGGAYGTG